MLKTFWNYICRETADDIIEPVKVAINKLHRSAANHHELADAHAAAANISAELASKARSEAMKSKALAYKFTQMFTASV